MSIKIQRTPNGFEKITEDKGTIVPMTAISGVAIYAGQAVQQSGGLLVPADDGTTAVNFAGIAQTTNSSTSTGSIIQVDTDESAIWSVVMSDATITDADTLDLVGVAAAGKTVLGSGNTNDVFIIKDVKDLTNNIVSVKLNIRS